MQSIKAVLGLTKAKKKRTTKQTGSRKPRSTWAKVVRYGDSSLSRGLSAKASTATSPRKSVTPCL